MKEIATAIWQPLRFKRAYAAEGEDATPYLRPYDVFEYLPRPADWLSTSRSENLDRYRVEPGTILVTCSGRNLGPLTIGDDHLAQFALSHDMVRVKIEDERTRSLVFALLSAPTGQALLRQGMSGSVIDHLTTRDVQELALPQPERRLANRVHASVAQHLELMSSGRTALTKSIDETSAALPRAHRPVAAKDGWTLQSSRLRDAGRMDVHFNDPHLDDLRAGLIDCGGVALREVAEVFLPGRYKRFYVSAAHGRPILSGRQILQTDPINLRYISDRSFADPAVMELRQGMVVFGAVGRWEGRLGDPALVGPDRDGWLASNDVMRVTPREGVDPAWLWRAIASPQVQAQIGALPYGSVVDHTGPSDIEGVVLPPEDDGLDAVAAEGWNALESALAVRRSAVQDVEGWIEDCASDVPLAGEGAA